MGSIVLVGTVDDVDLVVTCVVGRQNGLDMFELAKKCRKRFFPIISTTIADIGNIIQKIC